MSDILITVAEIKYPEPGKKQGAIYDTAGNRWGVWADKLENYAIGQSYSISEYDTYDFKGKSYHTIKKASRVASAGAPQPSYAPVRQAPPQFVPQAAPQAMPQQPPVPTPDYQAIKDIHIFVCGAINNTLSNPNVNPLSLELTDLIALMNKYQTAYRNTLGKRHHDHDLNDEIVL